MSNNSNGTTTNNDVGKYDDADTEQSKQQQQQRTSGTTTYKPGDVILTLYGVGVIVAVSNTANDNNYYTVRLWRIPGKSISSCAIAYLIPSCIQGRLPVAPGMIAYLKQEDDVMVSTTTSTSANDWNTTSTTTQQSEKQRRRVLIHCYSPSRDIYIATPYNNNDSSNDDTEPNQKPSLLELKPNEISHTFNSSKVYPILESLMSRAEQTATVVTTQLQQKLLATQKVMHNANKIMTQNANTTSTNTSTPTDSAEENPATAIISSLSHNVSETTTKYIEDMTIEIENKSPMIEENLKNLITVVKDEEITILLQKCKHRLQQLLFLDNDDNADTTNNSKSNAEMSILQTLEKHSGVKIVFEHDDDDDDDDNEEEEVESDSKDASNTTKATSKTQMKKKKISISKSVKLSQQVAIKALEQVLLQQTDIASIMNEKDITDMKDEIIQNFMNVFDTLQNVAQTDRVMHDLFDKYTSKTTTFYQNITGRLLQTKSANLFLDGATRLHTRAAAIFGNNPLIANNNNFGLNEIFNNLTKSFTEGDAALARLKSIELGDAVKNKLIHAIEIRSESLGGLDGIIAGALSNVVVTGKEINSNNNIQNLLNNLQQAASSAAMNAHETLISVLSSHSRYRDLALLRIEQTLCDLLLDNTNMIDDDDNDNDVGTFISGIIDDPERLAAIVQGEGGTAQIFEPIAKRAMKQIEQQLDVAEQHIINNTDNNIGPIGYDPALLLDGLKRVRKLMSGELTLSGLMEEIVNVLNDENVVAVGETLVQHGERVLDVLEGGANNASNLLKNSNHDTNKVVVEALQLVEKAGITKDVVMRELDQLNVNELLGTAESAVHDEKVRQQLLSSATDTALDFVLKILPSMPVPPFEGVKDGLLYTISNLSMEGFKVRKEDIRIDLAGIRATKSQDKKNSSKNNAQGQSNMNQSNHEDISGNVDYTTSTTTTSSIPIKATELLIIDIQRISTNLDNALWSFEQTYLPYLKGNGAAYIKMSGGAIRLQFELRKQRKRKKVDRTTSNTNDNGNGKESVAEEESWEPVLCLHDRTCTIAEVDLSLQGEGRLTWILNKLVTIFKGPLRDYVVRTIVRVLSNQSGWILKRFNTMLSPYWDLILRTAKLDMNDLVEADHQVIVDEEDVPDRRRIELVWRERLPLGMNLLMNDESGLLKVVDFPRGSAARAVCEKRNLNPDLFKGSVITSVNGGTYSDQEELFDALKDPSRPKAIQFELAKSEEVEKLLDFVEGPNRNETRATTNEERPFQFRQVEFTEPGALGIEFTSSIDNGGLVVNGFLGGDGGTVLAAAKTGKVNIGDILTHINDECVLGFDDGQDARTKAVKLLESAAQHRPLILTFVESFVHRIVIEKPASARGLECSGGPAELVLNERQVDGARRIYIEGFQGANGVAENSGLFIGDHLVFLNGLPVGVGCEWLGAPNPPTFEEVDEMLKCGINYPIGLTFARPMKQTKQRRWGRSSSSNKFRDSEAETICVVADSYDQLGCVFCDSNNSKRYVDVVVGDFVPVPGIFQRSIMASISNCKVGPTMNKKMSIESVNGQFVPTYASVDMVKNAIMRSWSNSAGEDNMSSSPAGIELVLCDDDLKQWLKKEISAHQAS